MRREDSEKRRFREEKIPRREDPRREDSEKRREEKRGREEKRREENRIKNWMCWMLNVLGRLITLTRSEVS
jgi:hypothetical protein